MLLVWIEQDALTCRRILQRLWEGDECESQILTPKIGVLDAKKGHLKPNYGGQDLVYEYRFHPIHSVLIFL